MLFQLYSISHNEHILFLCTIEKGGWNFHTNLQKVLLLYYGMLIAYLS